jgi:hypothetical protein
MPSIQIRDLPERLHRKLKAEARKEHRSFSQQGVVTIARGLGMIDKGLSDIARKYSIRVS